MTPSDRPTSLNDFLAALPPGPERTQALVDLNVLLTEINDCLSAALPTTPAPSLDAAWAAAEAALPEGWCLEVHQRPDTARAEAWEFAYGVGGGFRKAEADTPAAALLALRAALEGSPHDPE